MSWEDRDYAADDPMRRYGRPGGDWQGLRPTLDNPMTWSVTVGRILAITVRVHVVFLIFIVIELLRGSFGTTGLGFVPTTIFLACLFGTVFLHEIGHIQACRSRGGTADEILMWPLGGLAYCRPPNHATAHLVTAVGGPTVNVVILVVLTPTIGLLTGRWWGVAIPNPFDLQVPLQVVESWLLMTLFFANTVSVVLLLLNLLPIFPLDGGRILQAVLWPKLGYARSMRIAVRAGYVGAIALAITGVVTTSFMLVFIALFGGITCWITHKQLEFTQEMMGFETADYSASLDEPPAPPRPSRREMRRRQREQQEADELDAILRKIADSGMESLTGGEKRVLRRATASKKKQESS